MKNKILSVVVVCLSLFFIMCDTEHVGDDKSLANEKEAIQDISLEQWAKDNAKILATYSREDISTYSRTVQKAILRSFSPEKRKEIWQSKVDYLVSSSDFSKDEKRYLQWFSDTFKSLSYDKAFDQDVAQEMYDKAIAGIDEFGWPKGKIHKMFFTIGNIKTDNNQQQSRRYLIQAPGDDTNGTWCECYYDLGCPNWDCDSDANCDNSGDSPHDCGIFGGTDCDGNC